MGRPVIFCASHPDDETLGAGVSIAEHVAAGRDVRVLLMTRGTSSSVIHKLNGSVFSPWWGASHNPAVEGYQPLTPEALGEARLQEFTAAVGCLGVPADRIYEASTLLGESAVDGAVDQNQAYRAILAVVALLDPAAGIPGLWGPSYHVDSNPDHLALGAAIQQLGAEDPVRFADRRHWVLPPYWQDPRLSEVPGRFWDYPATVEIYGRVRNACRSYAAWSPAAGSYAIGYHSVDVMFALMDGSAEAPKCMIHK